VLDAIEALEHHDDLIDWQLSRSRRHQLETYGTGSECCPVCLDEWHGLKSGRCPGAWATEEQKAYYHEHRPHSFGLPKWQGLRFARVGDLGNLLSFGNPLRTPGDLYELSPIPYPDAQMSLMVPSWSMRHPVLIRPRRNGKSILLTVDGTAPLIDPGPVQGT
jgi:hypothetical protein